jgi:hypothetical protein
LDDFPASFTGLPIRSEASDLRSVSTDGRALPVNSPAVNSSDLEAFGNDNQLDVYCVNIFDTRSEKLVGLEGYAAVDLPRRRSTARFGTYSARYIGTGA